MDDPLVFAVKLALGAGNLLRSFYNPTGVQATAKPDRTVITEADLAADRMITEAIQEYSPQDTIISEESSRQIVDPHAPIWVIDPLDGTTNFSLGLTIWGVSIGYLVNGSPELGVLYFPLANELYTARHGGGAFLNNKPITVRAPDPTQPMSFFACCSRTFRYYEVSIPYKPRILGSCTYSYCMVARGSALLGFDVTPKIWDLAAVWLLVEEAGGKIAALEGSNMFPLSSMDDFAGNSHPTLASATPELFDMGKKNIQRKAKFAVIVQDN